MEIKREYLDYETCPHKNVVSEVCDQTLGVACNDCNTVLGCCWMDMHVSEQLWNRVCISNLDCVPCKKDREDVCFLCNMPFNGRSDGCAKCGRVDNHDCTL